MVKGQIIEKNVLVQAGFDFTARNYLADAYFSDGSCLRGVSVLEQFCYSLSSTDKVLVFRPEDQDKGFRLNRILEN